MAQSSAVPHKHEDQRSDPHNPCVELARWCAPLRPVVVGTGEGDRWPSLLGEVPGQCKSLTQTKRREEGDSEKVHKAVL